ncbi:hypothetical protein EYF80_015465 [Liparis tanakae]|uniref:Uncharacterized protein n=1 Tax=Liparis tanakae TaxID=230148 RepID=A0A4Z2I9Z3_9TELE|nr:hypothetical protein EYF80_015465 [Liparis tanakae]
MAPETGGHGQPPSSRILLPPPASTHTAVGTADGQQRGAEEKHRGRETGESSVIFSHIPCGLYCIHRSAVGFIGCSAVWQPSWLSEFSEFNVAGGGLAGWIRWQCQSPDINHQPLMPPPPLPLSGVFHGGPLAAAALKPDSMFKCTNTEIRPKGQRVECNILRYCGLLGGGFGLIRGGRMGLDKQESTKRETGKQSRGVITKSVEFVEL